MGLTVMTLCLLCSALPTTLQSVAGPKPARTINVCRVELTPMGRTARFYFHYHYFVKTGEDGFVKEVRQVSKERRPAFVREDKLVECVRTWKLEPSDNLSVTIGTGTSSAPTTISVVGHKGGATRIILP